MVRILCDLIRWYQQGISAQRPFRVCRFTPSCSQYMLEALQRFGFKGDIARKLAAPSLSAVFSWWL